MRHAIRLKTKVLPGSRIELTDPNFFPGEAVDVIVLAPRLPSSPARSVVEILAEATGHRAFQTAADVDEYLRKERESWD